MDLERVRLFDGGACSNLAKGISEQLGIPLSGADLRPFGDGERFAKFLENVRGNHIFLIQSTHPPAENLMQLLVMIDAAKRASAEKITAVIPYFAYGRQERKKEGRVPITAKMVAILLEAVGVHRVVTLEFHSAAIQGFFEVPCDHLYMFPIVVPAMREVIAGANNNLPLALVSADVNGAKFVRNFKANHFPDAKIVIVDKDRIAHGKSKVVNVYGDSPLGCRCFIVDDMIDTGGSIIDAADAVLEREAAEVHAFAAHPIFSGNAIERLEKSCLTSIHVGDTIPLQKELVSNSKIVVHSFAPLFAAAIKAVAEGTSVSKVGFEER